MNWFNALPIDLQAWLFSASAETAGGLVVELTTRLTDAAGVRLQRKLQGDPQQAALAAGLAAALQPLGFSFTRDSIRESQR